MQSFTGLGITVVGVGVYNALAPTLTDGQEYQMQLDPNGNIKTTLATFIEGEDSTNHVLGTIRKNVVSSAYSPSRFTNFGTATKANVKVTPGQVLSVAVSNAAASVRYFQVHNKATAPAGADVPVISVPIPIGAGSTVPPLVLTSEFFSPNGEWLSTGVGWAISTSNATFTDSASAADHSVNGHYV